MTRTKPKVVENGETVVCESCEMYERGYDDGSECSGAALAAIQYALGCEYDDGLGFLFLWNEGLFHEIRDSFPNAPKEVFIGTDPLYKEEK